MGRDKGKASIHLRCLYYLFLKKDSLRLFSPDMYSIVFSCFVYSCSKAFGKKRENKTHRIISHSTVYSLNGKYEIWMATILQCCMGQH